MNKFKVLVQGRYPLAVVSGLLLAFAFPKAGVAGFAWAAPGLTLAAALGTRGGEAFRIGYVAGLARYLASLYWLLLIPVTGFPILGWIALCAYLALYPAVWIWLAMKIANLDAPMAGAATAGLGPAPIRQIATWSWGRRTLWAVYCAASWVALEMIVARLLGGFPWDLLGVSQYQILPLIQIASITGVYGVSFVVVWTSISLLNAAAAILSRPAARSVWLGDLLLPLAVVAAAFVFGFHRIRRQPAADFVCRATLVQPSIPQTLIWNPENDDARFNDLIRLSEAALDRPTDVLIWPEAAIPKLLRYDENTFQAVTNLAFEHRVWMIVGSDDAEPSRQPGNPRREEYYNSSFLIGPRGELLDRYKKRSLVIFGEYIPLEHSLPFIKWFTPVQGSFTPGDRPVQFELQLNREGRKLRVKTSPLICFEDVFPSLGREAAGSDTDFLVNLTNDGWFGESAAQWQHAATAAFRAIENDIPLVRCTNTGLTCWFDSVGRLREWFQDSHGGIYGKGFITVNIPLLKPGEKRAPTFYHRHGDWFGWSCLAITVVAAVGACGEQRYRCPFADC